jgi:hypothetical protein
MSSSAPHWPDDGTERPGERPALRVVPPLAPQRPQPGGRPAAGDPAGEWSRLAGLREPSERDLAAARRRARPQLPSPVAVTRDVAMALLEVEAGCRSAAQIERICSPELWVRLEHRIGRRGGPLPSGRSVISVRCQENRPGVADTVVLVRRGERMLPVAMRLDAAAGRWTVTELRWWCTEHDPEAPACRGDRGECKPVGTRARRCGEAARGGGDRWRRWRSGTGRSCGPRPPSGWTCRPPRRGAARDAGCGSSSPGGPADRRLRRALPEGERGAALARVLPGPIGPVRRGGRWGRRGSSCTSCLTRTGRAGCGRPSCRRCGPGAGRRRHAARPR